MLKTDLFKGNKGKCPADDVSWKSVVIFMFLCFSIAIGTGLAIFVSEKWYPNQSFSGCSYVATNYGKIEIRGVLLSKYPVREVEYVYQCPEGYKSYKKWERVEYDDKR
jgi:hypothetical protein